MVNDIIFMLVESFSAAGSWFTGVMTATGAGGILLAAIFLVYLVRYLISPIVGSGSDMVKKSFKRDKNSSDSGDDA